MKLISQRTLEISPVNPFRPRGELVILVSVATGLLAVYGHRWNALMPGAILLGWCQVLSL